MSRNDAKRAWDKPEINGPGFTQVLPVDLERDRPRRPDGQRLEARF